MTSPAAPVDAAGDSHRHRLASDNSGAARAIRRFPSKSLSVPLRLASSTASSSSSSDDEDSNETFKRHHHGLRPVSPSCLALLPHRQVRVVLWAVPRSISTAFFRAIMEGARIKVLLEPFSNAYYFGEERISQRYLDKPPTAGCRFSDITDIYEEPYTRYKAVFAKDMAYYLTSQKPMATFSRLLPRGYTHTFLIRHPSRSVASLYKLSIDKARTGWDWFNAAEAGFKELYELFIFVTQRLGQQAIVVEANDLIKNPRKTLIRYCSLTGLEFSDKMLSWKSIDYTLTSESAEKETAAVPISGIYREEDEGSKAGQQQPQSPASQQQPVNLETAAEKQMSIPPQIFRGWQPWFEGVLSSTSFCEFNLPPPVPLLHQAMSVSMSSNKPPPPPTPPSTPSSKEQMPPNGPVPFPAINLPTASATNTSTKGSASTLPDKVNECIAECLPYYEYLKKFKI